jgi:hypothetical protein
MPRLIYSEYSGLNYPDNSWSARVHRVLRALWIIVVAGAIGGIGGGSVAFTILHLTGGSPRQEVAGAAGKQQPVTVGHPAARPPRIAAASSTTAPRAAVSVAAPTGAGLPAAVSAATQTATAPHAALSATAPTATAPTATAPPAAVSATAPTATAPTATAPPAALSATAPTATAPPTALSPAVPPATAPPAALFPAAPPAAVSAIAPTATAPPAAAVQHAAAPALPMAPSPSFSANQQPRAGVANKSAETEPDDSLDAASASAAMPHHTSVWPRPLARVRRHATHTNGAERRALAENAHSRPRPLPHYDRPYYDRYDRAYEAKRSRYPQNWASYNWRGGYWRPGGWGGGGYWRSGGWGGGNWGE